MRRKLEIKDEIGKANNSNDGLKEMVEKQNNKREASSVQIICKKLEVETKNKDIVKEILKKENSTFKESLSGKLDTKDEIGKVNKGRKNKNNNLKEEIEERLKLIERSIVDTQNDSLTELTKKIKILNTHLDIDKKRDIAILNTTELSDNEKIGRHVSNTICYKCK